jgi:hypothetical protein
LLIKDFDSMRSSNMWEWIGEALTVVVGVGLVGLASSATASELKTKETLAQAVVVLEDSATMYYHHAGWITSTSGVVRVGGFPKQISLGDILSADDNEIVVNIIIVTEVLEDYSGWGMDLKAGEITCLIAESEADIPTEVEIDRLWVRADKCLPLQ